MAQVKPQQIKIAGLPWGLEGRGLEGRVLEVAVPKGWI